MEWIKRYQLFLLDFDGLLVNTEELHYRAYQKMCSEQGVELTWSFPEYCGIAHSSADGIQREMYRQFPRLHEKQPQWDVLYADKKRILLQLFETEKISLMPGVESFLQELDRLGAKHCVVTHSTLELIQRIRKQNPALDTIPHWITREDYTHPKPHSECYEKAIAKLASQGDLVVGFEDTPRGVEALLGTSADPVMISTIQYPETPFLLERGVRVYPSFLQVK